MKRRVQTGAAIGAVVLAAVGAVDAARRDSLALATLFAVVALLDVVVLLGLRRHTIEIRRDHHAWLARVSTVTGEPVETVVDRAVGEYRDARGT